MFGPINPSDAAKYGIFETTASGPILPANPTEYVKLPSDAGQTIGVTHHSTGMGKLKVFDKESDAEYGVPITDILNRHVKDWRIDKK